MKTKLLNYLGVIGFLLSQILYSQENQENKEFVNNEFNVHLSFLGKQVIGKDSKIRSYFPSIKTIYITYEDKKVYADQALQYLPLVSVHFEWDMFMTYNWYYQDSSTYLYYTTSPNTGKLLEEKVFLDSMPDYYQNYRTIYRYDNLGRRQCIARMYNYNRWINEWFPSNRDTFYYSTTNKPTMIEEQNYDTVYQTFYVETRYVRNYNFYNKLISEKAYYRYYDSLKPSYQITVSYNSQQKYTSITYEELDENNPNNITYKTRESYIYDADGKIKEAIDVEWNFNTNQWDTLGKVLVSWYKWVSSDVEDICNNLPATMIFQNRYASGVYLNSEKYEYSYDPIDDENIEEKDYYWGRTIGNWVWRWGRKEILTRNSYYGNMITQKLIQYKQGLSQNYESYSLYVYKQPTLTNVQQTFVQSNILTLFPNPNKGQFYLLLNKPSENAQFYITDIMGRKIEQNITFTLVKDNLFRFSTSHLEKGIYFINFVNENTGSVNTQKFMIE